MLNPRLLPLSVVLPLGVCKAKTRTKLGCLGGEKTGCLECFQFTVNRKETACHQNIGVGVHLFVCFPTVFGWLESFLKYAPPDPRHLGVEIKKI